MRWRAPIGKCPSNGAGSGAWLGPYHRRALRTRPAAREGHSLVQSVRAAGDMLRQRTMRAARRTRETGNRERRLPTICQVVTDANRVGSYRVPVLSMAMRMRSPRSPRSGALAHDPGLALAARHSKHVPRRRAECSSETSDRALPAAVAYTHSASGQTARVSRSVWAPAQRHARNAIIAIGHGPVASVSIGGYHLPTPGGTGEFRRHDARVTRLGDSVAAIPAADQSVVLPSGAGHEPGAVGGRRAIRLNRIATPRPHATGL
jgi:hypothetical protein